MPLSMIFSPLGAFLLHAAALWPWHIPYLYQATIEFDFIHALQHLSFFLSGLLFWSALFGAGRSTMTYGAGVPYVFGAALEFALRLARFSLSPPLSGIRSIRIVLSCGI